MIALVHPSPNSDPITPRLHATALPWRPAPPGRIPDLATDSADLVYLVSRAAMTAPTWARLRVQLAEANRLFLAALPILSSAEVVACMRDGAHDVLTPDDSHDRWTEAFNHAVAAQKLWIQLYGGCDLKSDELLIGRSDAIVRLRLTIAKLGATDVGVLVQGESGVGKERVAAALHRASRAGPFVALNCAAIPKDLLESELFGVAKGAFTGALKARPGLVEQAAGGTLFLDEIGDLDPALQPKVLRFLETRRARRIGGDTEYEVKVRVVSATNRNLEADIARQLFRLDLYYRLAEVILHLPPLRARLEDIPELALAFLRQANQRFGKNFETFEPALIERFQQHDWPGNVRELKSAVDRLVLLFDGPLLRAAWWQPAPGPVAPNSPQPSPAPSSSPPPTTPLHTPSPVAPSPPPAAPTALPTSREKIALAAQFLQESNHNYTLVAARLGIHPTTLWRWRKAGLIPPPPA